MYFQWKPYVSVAERRRKAERVAARLQKKGKTLLPVTGGHGAITRTFWGKAWCDNLERYSDYSNRLPRGRTYLRNGSVIDLNIAAGAVSAQVMGSSLYQVAVKISAVPATKWQALSADCAASIDSLVELLQGRLSKGVMERICQAGTGLFPSPKEITFSCSCPDWAAMCKHVAAVFYGIGARLDEQPDLLFTLRRVDAQDLVARAGTGLPLAKKRPATGKVLDDAKLAEVFGIEMADTSAPAARGKRSAVSKKASVPRKTPMPKNATAQKNVSAAKKASAAKKTPIVRKTAGKRKATIVLARSASASKHKRDVSKKETG